MRFKENQSLYQNQQSYLEVKATSYKAKQTNRKTINDLQHFSSAILERTTEVFKMLLPFKKIIRPKKIVTQNKIQNV